MSESTSIEKIKAFHSIKKYLNEEQQKEMIEILQLQPVDIEKRLWGKDNEVEFILMIHLLQWCKSIVGFEEGVAQLTDTVASDLFVELNNGTKLVVEIKSTTEDKYTISEKLLTEKEKFAEKINAKLYFAIKTKGYWMLFSSEYIRNHNRKIFVEKDYLNSELNSIFGDRTFIFPQGLSIKSTYSKTSVGMGISNNDYGNLVKYEVTYNGTRLLRLSSSSDKFFFLTIAFENLQDMMSNDSQEIIRIDDVRTMIVEKLTHETSMMNLSLFILSPIRHLINDLGHAYDFNEYLTLLIEKKDNFLSRQHFMLGLSFLAENKYPLLEKRGQNIYKFEDMIIKQE